MKGQRTPAEMLEHLRKEAKRRLKAFQKGEKGAVDWYRQTLPGGPAAPSLRDMQLAVARTFDFPGWTNLKRALETPLPDPASPQGIVDRFLDNACPDHHVRGKQDHRRAEATAMRLLEQNPWLRQHDFNTAIVCGEIDYVRDAIARDKRTAVVASSPPSAKRGMAGGENDLYEYLGPKGWTPLLYLSFTRLPTAAANDNAVAIAQLLLDAGADPNAYYHAGDSHYTPMTGVAGEGEEDRPPHPRRVEITKLLLDAGANPYDIQVVYDLGFKSDYMWWLPIIHEASVSRGRIADWQDPEWRMLDMGGYGCGARWFLEHAIASDNQALAAWCLEHGAGANAPPGSSRFNSKRSLYEAAIMAGRREIAGLLLQYGATATSVNVSAPSPYEALCRAASENDVAEIHRLVDSGISPNIADDKNTRPLNHAAWSNALEAVKALLERGAEIDSVEQNYGGTALGNASHFLFRDIMDFLAPLSKDVWNLTYNGYIDRLREVIEEKPERARVDWDEWSPLLWLPPHDEDLALETVKLFMKHGADPHRRASNGATPLSRAEALGMTRVAKFLQKADPSLHSG